jgi:hypothetical protein
MASRKRAGKAQGNTPAIRRIVASVARERRAKLTAGEVDEEARLRAIVLPKLRAAVLRLATAHGTNAERLALVAWELYITLPAEVPESCRARFKEFKSILSRAPAPKNFEDHPTKTSRAHYLTHPRAKRALSLIVEMFELLDGEERDDG